MLHRGYEIELPLGDIERTATLWEDEGLVQDGTIIVLAVDLLQGELHVATALDRLLYEAVVFGEFDVLKVDIGVACIEFVGDKYRLLFVSRGLGGGGTDEHIRSFRDLVLAFPSVFLIG